MARKVMTAEELKAFDWASLLAKLPALAAILAQLLELFKQKQGQLKACPDDCCCPQEVKDACDVECEALATLILAHCGLHEVVEKCNVE